MRPLPKWNTRVEMPVVIPEVIRKAFKIAEAEKPGACHVEVPEDVAEEPAEGEPLSTERPRRPSPDRQALQSAARLIEAASFPLIFAGNGVIRGNAAKELRELSRAHGIPIDFPPAEVDGYYQPAVEVVADVREALELLNGLVKGQKDPAPYRALRGYILEQLAEGADDDAFPIKPQRILRDLRAVMGREDILVSDVGSHKLWIARTFPAYDPNSVLISNGLAAMGVALPAAVAAK